MVVHIEELCVHVYSDVDDSPRKAELRHSEFDFILTEVELGHSKVDDLLTKEELGHEPLDKQGLYTFLRLLPHIFHIKTLTLEVVSIEDQEPNTTTVARGDDDDDDEEICRIILQGLELVASIQELRLTPDLAIVSPNAQSRMDSFLEAN
jgi:hypothetical protein